MTRAACSPTPHLVAAALRLGVHLDCCGLGAHRAQAAMRQRLAGREGAGGNAIGWRVRWPAVCQRHGWSSNCRGAFAQHTTSCAHTVQLMPSPRTKLVCTRLTWLSLMERIHEGLFSSSICGTLSSIWATRTAGRRVHGSGQASKGRGVPCGRPVMPAGGQPSDLAAPCMRLSLRAHGSMSDQLASCKCSCAPRSAHTWLHMGTAAPSPC